MARIRLLAAGVLLALLTLLAVPASAQYVGVPPPTVVPDGGVEGQSGRRTPVTVDQGGGIQATSGSRAQASSGRLALTGTDVIELVALAGALLGVGAVLTAGARRRRITA